MNIDHFSWLFDDIYSKTDPLFNWQKADRPIEYQTKVLENANKSILVTSCGFLAQPQVASMSYSRFQSPIIDICTALVYPTASPDIIPVFVVELVAVKNNIHVVIVDTEWLVSQPMALFQDFQKLKNNWELLFPDKADKPAWFVDIESPYAIYSKSSSGQNENIRTMVNEYLDCTCDLHYSQKKQLFSGKDHPLVINYKHHHAKHSPARTIVKGEHKQWLDIFLNQYHFGIV